MQEGQGKHFARCLSGDLGFSNREQTILVINGDYKSLKKIVREESVHFAALEREIWTVVDRNDLLIEEFEIRQSERDVLEEFHLHRIAPYTLRLASTFGLHPQALRYGLVKYGGVCAGIQNEP